MHTTLIAPPAGRNPSARRDRFGALLPIRLDIIHDHDGRMRSGACRALDRISGMHSGAPQARPGR